MTGSTQFMAGATIHLYRYDLPESLTWLWRDYDPARTEQSYEMDESERSKPVYRVKIGNRDAW